MRLPVKFLLFFCLAFVFSDKQVSAQVKIHRNLNIDNGLVYSQVLYIHEDRMGYMWFGTSSGISRWDGISFKNFLLPDNLSDNNCKWIAEFPLILSSDNEKPGP